MTSMRRRYVASTSLRRHVPAGNSPPPPWPPNILNLNPPKFYTFLRLCSLHWVQDYNNNLNLMSNKKSQARCTQPIKRKKEHKHIKRFLGKTIFSRKLPPSTFKVTLTLRMSLILGYDIHQSLLYRQSVAEQFYSPTVSVFCSSQYNRE